MNRICLLFSFVFFSLLTCSAEEKKPSGIVAKPVFNSFTQARVDLRRDTLFYKQEKVIFGLDVKFNENWSVRVTVDFIRMTTLYLKPAVLTWRKDNWTVESGVIFTSEMDKTAMQFWGNRFIDRVSADRWLYSPTADLGFRATYKWNDFITTDVSIVGGNGYQRLTEKYHPQPAFRAILSPVKPLQLGGYIAARKEEKITETLFNCFAHLQMGNKWKITGEYHHKANCRFADGHKIDVASIYSTYQLLSWLALMGRYDFVKSNRVEPFGESWNVQEDGRLFIGGLIFRCFPSVRLSIDYWSKRPSVKRIDKEDWLYLCVEYKY